MAFHEGKACDAVIRVLELGLARRLGAKEAFVTVSERRDWRRPPRGVGWVGVWAFRTKTDPNVLNDDEIERKGGYDPALRFFQSQGRFGAGISAAGDHPFIGSDSSEGPM